MESLRVSQNAIKSTYGDRRFQNFAGVTPLDPYSTTFTSSSNVYGTNPSASKCWFLCPKRTKTHLRASVRSKFFRGLYPRTPKRRGREETGKEGQERRREGGTVRDDKGGKNVSIHTVGSVKPRLGWGKSCFIALGGIDAPAHCCRSHCVHAARPLKSNDEARCFIEKVGWDEFRVYFISKVGGYF